MKDSLCPRCQHPHDQEFICEFDCLICANEFFKEVLEDDEYLDYIGEGGEK